MQMEQRDVHEKNARVSISLKHETGRNVNSSRNLHSLKHLRSRTLTDEGTENEVMERSVISYRQSFVATVLSGREDEDFDIRWINGFPRPAHRTISRLQGNQEFRA
jgi:hypothetical protein